MTDYISREAFLEQYRSLYCSDCDGRKNSSGKIVYEIGDAPCRACDTGDMLDAVEDFHAANVVEVVWKSVVGYEGLYEVSNLGSVRTCEGNNVKQSISQKPNTCYKTVWLKKDGTGKSHYVHRLVAEAFIANPDRLPIVNHRDEDGTNNRVDNLEWCTNEYNLAYGTAQRRRSETVRGRKLSKDHKSAISASVKQFQNSEVGTGKKVVCLETGEVFTSIGSAAEHFGISRSTIGMGCQRKTNGREYTFRYLSDMDGGADNA